MKHRLSAIFLALAAAGLLRGQAVSDALTKGTFSFDERLRWESVDQENLRPADAFTLRSLFGYASAPVAGLQGVVEGGNTAVLNNEGDYSAAGTNASGAGRGSIPEVPVTYINQAWASYDNSDLLVKAGRQRLNLDTARFIGDSGWWQKMQTFDAATLTATPEKGLSVFYGYVWHVNRIYGNEAPQPDFVSKSNLINVSYGAWTYGTFTAYAYLLDFANSAANSSNTYGGSFSGAAPLTKDVKITYRAEAATQSSGANNPVSYTAPYYRGDLGGSAGPADFGIGWEELGSDGGVKGFATPLATLHIFDGWANEFLTTPPYGLKDAFASAGLTLPGTIPLKVIYHDFQSAYGGQTYGHEWDGMISHKFGKHWTLLVETARFYGNSQNKPTALFGTRKLWLQAEATF